MGARISDKLKNPRASGLCIEGTGRPAREGRDQLQAAVEVHSHSWCRICACDPLIAGHCRKGSCNRSNKQLAHD